MILILILILILGIPNTVAILENSTLLLFFTATGDVCANIYVLFCYCHYSTYLAWVWQKAFLAHPPRKGEGNAALLPNTYHTCASVLTYVLYLLTMIAMYYI